MEHFYDRTTELAALDQIDQQAKEYACFTLLTGRRRIGKTELLRHFIQDKKSAYLFVMRDSEADLCSQWQKMLEQSIGLKFFGTITSLADLFEQIMIFSQDNHFILVMDEFQDLQFIAPSFFSKMQNLWDSYKSGSKINLIACGSVYSLMTKIFQDSKEPLFGRYTHHIHLKPFTPSVVKKILGDFNPKYTAEDLLCLYMLSGGVVKYIFLLMYGKATTKDKMISYATSMTSPFLMDGKDILVSEIGKEYGIYFSILKLISQGKTSQSEIDSIILKNTGAYLKNLERVFGVIRPIKPLLSKPESRNVHWQIIDNYLRFYFRFMYANQYLIELGQYDLLQKKIHEEYKVYTGKTLEHYFMEKIAEEEDITQMGSWWNKRSQNEIDIITLNEAAKSATIMEVKRQAKKISLEKLREKSAEFEKNLPGYQIHYKGLSLDDM